MENELDMGTSLDQVTEWLPEQSGEEILTHAIRHIQRLHMNCRTWTLPAGDDDAITLMRDVRATHRAYTPLVAK